MKREQIEQKTGISFDQLSPKMQNCVTEYENSLEQFQELNAEFDSLDDDEKEEAKEELAELKGIINKLQKVIAMNLPKSKVQQVKPEPKNEPTPPAQKNEPNPPAPNDDDEPKKGGKGLFWVLGLVGLGLLGYKALKK